MCVVSFAGAFIIAVAVCIAANFLLLRAPVPTVANDDCARPWKAGLWRPVDAVQTFLRDPQIEADGWTLARTIAGEQHMRVFTRQSGGHLSLRIEGVVAHDGARILSVLREVDLLERWNRFCDGAETLSLLSPTELWAAAGVALPWPVPKLSLLIHAHVAPDPTGHAVIAVAQSPSASVVQPSNVRLPPFLRGRAPLPVHLAVARLRTLPPQAQSNGQATRQRTGGDIFITFDMSAIGLVPSAGVPTWLINIIVYIAVPSIWHGYLAALAAMDMPANPHAERVLSDESGLYALVARWAGQQRRVAVAPTAASEASQRQGRHRSRWRRWIPVG